MKFTWKQIKGVIICILCVLLGFPTKPHPGFPHTPVWSISKSVSLTQSCRTVSSLLVFTVRRLLRGVRQQRFIGNGVQQAIHHTRTAAIDWHAKGWASTFWEEGHVRIYLRFHWNARIHFWEVNIVTVKSAMQKLTPRIWFFFFFLSFSCCLSNLQCIL